MVPDPCMSYSRFMLNFIFVNVLVHNTNNEQSRAVTGGHQRRGRHTADFALNVLLPRVFTQKGLFKLHHLLSGAHTLFHSLI